MIAQDVFPVFLAALLGALALACWRSKDDGWFVIDAALCVAAVYWLVVR